MNTYLSAYQLREELRPDDFAYVISAGNYRIDGIDFQTGRIGGRSDYQLIYVRCGRVTVYDRGDPFEAGDGRVLLYRPFETQLYTYRSDPSSEYYWIHFSGTGIARLLDDLALNERDFVVGGVPGLIECFNMVISEIKLRQHGYAVLCAAELLRLLSVVSRERQKFLNPNLNDKKERIKDVVDFMHAAGVRTSIDEYAAMCYMSKYRFIHVFNSIMGMPPHAYQLRIALLKAKELLQNSNMSITEISEELGFSDIYYFSRFFKKQTGLSPSLYRKEQKGV